MLREEWEGGPAAPAGQRGTQPGRREGPESSLSRFERAAMGGDRESALMAAQIYTGKAEAHEALGNWAMAVEDWARARRCAPPVPGKQSGKDRRGRVEQKLTLLREGAVYGQAVGLYMLGRFREAAALLEEAEETRTDSGRTRALLGLTQCRRASGTWDEGSWRQAMENLRVLEPDFGYTPENSRNEQVFFAKAAVELAGLYRLGIPGFLTKDTQHARRILAAAVEKAEMPDVREWLEQELAHYQEKAQGGYVYQ